MGQGVLASCLGWKVIAVFQGCFISGSFCESSEERKPHIPIFYQPLELLMLQFSSLRKALTGFVLLADPAGVCGKEE